MKVVIKYNNSLVTVEMTPKKNSRYISKSIELFDDNRVKYTHVYDDHVSIKYHSLDPNFDYYRSLFNHD